MLVFEHEMDLEVLPHNTPKEIREIIANIVKKLDENYGVDRDLHEDGGSVILFTGENDYNEDESYSIGIVIGESIPEYVEEIVTSNGTYLNALYICNNEYTITVIILKDIAPKISIDEVN